MVVRARASATPTAVTTLNNSDGCAGGASQEQGLPVQCVTPVVATTNSSSGGCGGVGQ